ncbi:choline dehydrogenase-like flavoprotein [alpha proteobacterium IMCC14465]|uniref:Choline dehydrogenase-like flavoprotein n=1 Tax=alpha proteobacterium IMCC14465 TaxID=1220535 RepID=J9DI56_9PROT|nr:choline dehydrogenase-like flavoprotein [alpha proteobacterium IMCC14465]
MQASREFDYIIIGAGTAGCLLANRLSQNPDNKVLILEAGSKDKYLRTKIPVGYLFSMGNPKTDWCYTTEKEDGLNGRSLTYPRGRVLGGSSAINGMIYMRGQAQNYEHWKNEGNLGWGWDDVLPYFKKSEDYFKGANDFHGENGAWRVEQQRLSWAVLDSFADACVQAGIPPIEDFNRGTNFGVGYFDVNQRTGVRVSADSAFLKPIRHRKNLTIITDASVEKITFDGKKATGVIFHKNKTTTHAPSHVKAHCEVIISAGSINTPKILQLSGIGSGQLLRDFGIEIIHALDGVGQNLQDHLQIRTVFKLKNAKTLNDSYKSLFGKIGMGLEYLFNRSGPISMAPSQLGVFAKSDPHLDDPNLQYHIQPLSLDAFGEPLHTFSAITASVCNLQPDSRGTVTIRSPHLNDNPVIKPNYISSQTDKDIAAQSITLTRDIFNQDAMRKYEPTEFLPGAAHQSPHALAEQAGHISTSIFHPVGTAKMGTGKDAVVDRQLNVYGVQNLRVVDASIMPKITSGNTNSPTLMIAEKAADMILQNRR